MSTTNFTNEILHALSKSNNRAVRIFWIIDTLKTWSNNVDFYYAKTDWDSVSEHDIEDVYTVINSGDLTVKQMVKMLVRIVMTVRVQVIFNSDSHEEHPYWMIYPLSKIIVNNKMYVSLL